MEKSFFNEKWIKAMESGQWICDKCGATMEWEDEDDEYFLVCLKCGFSTNVDEYGFDDGEYQDMFPLEDDL